MTISKTPRTDYRHAYKDPHTHRFTKRPDSAVQRFIDNPRMDPHAVALLRDDTATTVKWDFTEQRTDIPAPPMPVCQHGHFGNPCVNCGATRVGAPPAPWQESAWRQDFEPPERETWRDVWADIRGVVLCAAFVLTVLAFGAHVAGLWGQ